MTKTVKTSRLTGDGDATKKKKRHCVKCGDQHPPQLASAEGVMRILVLLTTPGFRLDQLFSDQSQHSLSLVSLQTVEVWSCPPSYGYRIDALDNLVGSV